MPVLMQVSDIATALSLLRLVSAARALRFPALMAAEGQCSPLLLSDPQVLGRLLAAAARHEFIANLGAFSE
jgi:hypothetical protein